MFRRILCAVLHLGHRTAQIDGGYYCDRCHVPRSRPREW